MGEVDRDWQGDRDAKILFVGGIVVGLAAFVVPALLTGKIIDNYWGWGGGKGVSPFVTPFIVLAILGIPAGAYYAGRQEQVGDSGRTRALRIGGYSVAGMFFSAVLGGAVAFASFLGFLALALVLGLLGVD